VPDTGWPVQGMIGAPGVLFGEPTLLPAGHIKSNGFIPMPGCEHYSGKRYEPQLSAEGLSTVMYGEPVLMAAILADRAEWDAARRERSASGGGHGGGSGGGHDSEISRQVLSMVLRGLDQEQCYAQWLTIAVPRDPGWLFTRKDFDRHYGTASRKAAQIRAAEAEQAAAFEASRSGRQQAALPAAPMQGTVVGKPGVIVKGEGLKAVTAAKWVMSQGPLAYGTDNQLWAYQHGVWRPGESPGDDIVHKRIAVLLGEGFRQAHGTNIKEVIRAQVGPLRCEPVPDLINFRNGLLPWQQPAWPPQPLPHDPDVLSTVQMSVDWNPAAVCPRFDAFLASALAPGDVDRMWEVIGYLLMSGNPLHKMFLLTGSGFNGKGVLLRALTALLGTASVSSVSLHSLANDRFTRVGLVGRTANICGDIDATYIEHTGLLKQLTGEDLITAEHKFRPAGQFTCWAVPVFSANEIPTSSDTSPGWLRRWEVFAFPNTFAHDPALEPSLRAAGELEGIAAHGVRALRQMMARTPPELMRTAAGEAAKEEFRAFQDPLHGWFAECCWSDERWWTDRRDAYGSYKLWSADSGKGVMGRTKFYARMRERFTEVKQRGWDGYSGLRLRPPGS
jgi:P4 family phage/plasmid primase-like protien